MNFRVLRCCIFLIGGLQTAHSQSEFSFLIGGFYNDKLQKQDVAGIGLIMGLDYRFNQFASMEMRTRYGLYAFDDGTKFTTDRDGSLSSPVRNGNPRIEYFWFCPNIGVVPKLHLSLDEYFEGIEVFLENEFSLGFITGSIDYNGQSSISKKIREPIFCYNIGLGIELSEEYKLPFQVSFSYSTLDFKDNILKHKPVDFHEDITNQEVPFLINILFKIPFKHKKKSL